MGRLRIIMLLAALGLCACDRQAAPSPPIKPAATGAASHVGEDGLAITKLVAHWSDPIPVTMAPGSSQVAGPMHLLSVDIVVENRGDRTFERLTLTCQFGVDNPSRGSKPLNRGLLPGESLALDGFMTQHGSSDTGERIMCGVEEGHDLAAMSRSELEAYVASDRPIPVNSVEAGR